jgi:hypothetical protein
MTDPNIGIKVMLQQYYKNYIYLAEVFLHRSIKILFAKRNFLDKKFLLQDICIFAGLCIPNLLVPCQIPLFLQDLPENFPGRAPRTKPKL